MHNRKIFQLSLVVLGFIIIFLTYFSNLSEKQTVNLSKKKEIVEKENDEFLKEGINRFEDVEYIGIDKNGNTFVIGSEFAEYEKDRPEIINME